MPPQQLSLCSSLHGDELATLDETRTTTMLPALLDLMTRVFKLELDSLWESASANCNAVRPQQCVFIDPKHCALQNNQSTVDSHDVNYTVLWNSKGSQVTQICHVTPACLLMLHMHVCHIVTHLKPDRIHYNHDANLCTKSLTTYTTCNCH